MRNLLLLGIIFIHASLSAQCFIGIDSIYCTNGIPDTILPVDTGGYFDGDGISADGIFFPEILDPGSYVISYKNTQYYDVDTTGVFAPLSGDEQYVSLIDDGFSDGIEIGFDFEFFGSLKNYVRIHSNGFITFNFDLAIFPPYANDIPTPGMPTDLIAASWGDYDPTMGGTISWFQSGSAPNRKLVINYRDLPPYGETEGLLTTQVILFETTNIIEIHTTASPDYGKRKTQGIENIDGTAGYVRPGRNNSYWETYNDYVAFIPQFCIDTLYVENPPVTEVLDDEINICMPYAGLLHVSGADTYLWLSDDICTMTPGPDPDSYYLHGIAEGTFTCNIVGFNEAGCSDTSQVVVNIETCQTAITNNVETPFQITPNPANNILTIIIAANEFNGKWSLVNLQGAEMQFGELTGLKTEIDIRELPAGIYFLIFDAGDCSAREQFIISH
ncbi:MAG TPA: T9SS type A sorting domain-containing protein [Chitinophagales bacterium]|nr:T9SS type A sorting domain-containing protein [Chitinophagales bacterium]HNM28183.1 T9SS type A sorting domain-containing protein [Chitinophagales bacterium]